MLPSKGYFSTIPCFFYLIGSCERPHCHFRHSLQDIESEVTSCGNLVKNVSHKTVNEDAGKKNLFKKEINPPYVPSPTISIQDRHIPVVSVFKPLSDTRPNKSHCLTSYSKPQFLTNTNFYSPICDTNVGITEGLPSLQEKHDFSNSHESNLNNSNDCSLEVIFSSSSERKAKEVQKIQKSVGDSSDSNQELKSEPNHFSHEKNYKTTTTACGEEKSSFNDKRFKKKRKKTSSVQNDHLPVKNEVEENNAVISVDRTINDCTTAKSLGVNTKEMTSKEPSVKKKKTLEVLKPDQNIVSSVDSFSRWMKNKKLRKILGKSSENDKIVVLEKSKIVQQSGNIATEMEKQIELLPVPKEVKRKSYLAKDIHPIPRVSLDVKIGIGFRRYYCKMFFEEYRKSVGLEEARHKAVTAELEIATSSKLIKIYKNLCTLKLLKIRKGEITKSVVIPKKIKPSSRPEFTYGWTIYECYSKYLMCEEELKINGFPMFMPENPKCAYIDKRAVKYSIKQPDEPTKKICHNCSKEFEISADGLPTSANDCFYHWGRLRKTQFKGQQLEKYSCCDGMQDSVPCESSQYHVWLDNDHSFLEGFVSTKKLPSHLTDVDAGIYALDCEMCYTTKGLELARLTVVNVNEDVVFDEVVSLDNPVLDLCTRFSGINKDKIESAAYNFRDVRKWILRHFYDKTILVGHSLENDLKALKLVHSRIVDTSVIFPHKLGHPMKMSLKGLARTNLELNIQDGDEGHDSKEDAATCLKLIMKKIKEDSKVRKPRVIIGYNGKK